MMEKKLTILERILKYNFKKRSILEKALTHKSFNNNINNEKLEFLGDRVLGLIISERLLEKFPEEKEGIIDKKFAALVNKKTCLQIAKKINLEKFILTFNPNNKKIKIEDKITKKPLKKGKNPKHSLLDGGFIFVFFLDLVPKFIVGAKSKNNVVADI